MEVGLLIVLFLSNAVALDCLYNQRVKTTGALLVLNLCLTVAIAYQFGQMGKILYIFLVVLGIVLVYFGVKFYLKKKRQGPVVHDAEYMIEENE